MSNTVIQTTAADNVAIVAGTQGLQQGDVVLNGLVLKEAVPMGHKIALHTLQPGDAVVRYGAIIGYAATTIEAGCWINETNISLPAPPALNDIAYMPPNTQPAAPLTGYSFQGYKNADGSAGTKNVLGITTSVQCVAGITDFIVQKIKKELLPLYPDVDDVVAFNHSYGCGIAIDAPGAIVPIRTIKHIAQNPNFGGEIMIIGLGCEKLRPEKLLPDGQTADSSSVLYLQDESFDGFGGMVEGIMQMADARPQKNHLPCS
jgi:galactarate dehydratase